MLSFYRTQTLKIEAQPIFSEVTAASAAVWNACCYQMDMYQWQRGYPHAHRDFYIGKDCEGWMDKQLSHPILHSQSRQAVRERLLQILEILHCVEKEWWCSESEATSQTKNLYDDPLEKVWYPLC